MTRYLAAEGVRHFANKDRIIRLKSVGIARRPFIAHDRHERTYSGREVCWIFEVLPARGG